MTRPSWKSPAVRKGKRSQLNLDRLSIIDVSLEDDSLLPSAKKEPIEASHDSLDSSSVPDAGNPVKTPVVQESVAGSEAALARAELGKQTDMQPTISSQDPAMKSKKKKRGHFNLRKSLAWNNAFFTDEGVLDQEELSLVNKTFKIPPDLPKLNNRKTPVRSAKPLASTLTPKIKISPLRLEKSAMVVDSRRFQLNSLQCQGSGSNLCSPRSSTGSITGNTSDISERRFNKGLAAVRHAVSLSSSRMQAEPVKQVKQMLAPHSDFQDPKQVLSSTATDNDPRKCIFQPHVSGGAGSMKSTSVMTKEVPGFSKTVSSVSRKMKDTLGMVLAAPSNGFPKRAVEIAEEDSLRSVGSHSVSYLDSSEVAKVTRCYSHSLLERHERSTVTTSLESVSSNVFPSCPEAISTESSSTSQLENLVDNKLSFSVPPAGEHSLRQHSALKSLTTMDSKIPSPQGKAFVEPAPSVLFSQSQQVTSSSSLLQGTVLANTAQTSSFKSTETGAGSGPPPYRARPSGLRMPSPKLGFFDKARAMPTPQVTVLPERTSDLGHDGSVGQSGRNILPVRIPAEGGGTTNISQQSSGLKRPGFLAKSRQPLSEVSGHQMRGMPTQSGIPLAPHLRGNASSPWSLPSSKSAHSSPKFSNSLSNKNVSSIFNKGKTLQHEKNGKHRSLGEMAHNSPSTKEGTFNGINQSPIYLEKKRKNFHSVATVGAQVLSSIAVNKAGGGWQAAHHQTSGPMKHMPISSLGETANYNVDLDDGGCGHPLKDNLDTASATAVVPSRSNNFDHCMQNVRSVGDCKSQSVDRTSYIVVHDSVSSSQMSNHGIMKSCSTVQEVSLPGSANIPIRLPGTNATRVQETCELLSPQPGGKLSEADKKRTCGSPGARLSKDADRSSARSPFAVNNGNVLNRQGSNNQAKKEKTSIFSFAKKIVTQLMLSPPGNGSEQENAIPECQQNEEYQKFAIDQVQAVKFDDGKGFDSTILSPISEGNMSLEHSVQEWPDEQSGAVLHSPPDKIPAQPGPWSPVRKTGQQIGPFDCTKCTVAGLSH